MKLIQITDTHFSPTKRHFNGNWAPLLEWIEAEKPDLIIHTGDLTVDGADHDADIVFSLELMRQATAPMLILPGNHDVGHLPGSKQPVTAERLARWDRLAGPDRFVEDVAGWRLVGFNSLLMGMGDATEEAQIEWLSETLATADDRRIALFTHKPLFVDGPEEGDTGYWSVKPDQRRRIFELMADHDVALVATGHCTGPGRGFFGATALTWAPSAAFVIDTMEREMPGERLVGAAVHMFDGAEINSRIVAVPGMTAHVIDDIIDEVYPRSAPVGDAAE